MGPGLSRTGLSRTFLCRSCVGPAPRIGHPHCVNAEEPPKHAVPRSRSPSSRTIACPVRVHTSKLARVGFGCQATSKRTRGERARNLLDRVATRGILQNGASAPRSAVHNHDRLRMNHGVVSKWSKSWGSLHSVSNRRGNAHRPTPVPQPPLATVSSPTLHVPALLPMWLSTRCPWPPPGSLRASWGVGKARGCCGERRRESVQRGRGTRDNQRHGREHGCRGDARRLEVVANGLAMFGEGEGSLRSTRRRWCSPPSHKKEEGTSLP